MFRESNCDFLISHKYNIHILDSYINSETYERKKQNMKANHNCEITLAVERNLTFTPQKSNYEMNKKKGIKRKNTIAMPHNDSRRVRSFARENNSQRPCSGGTPDPSFCVWALVRSCFLLICPWGQGRVQHQKEAVDGAYTNIYIMYVRPHREHGYANQCSVDDW